MSTETPRTEQQHWAEAVAECITDEQEALRIVGLYEDGEWQPAMLAIGRENLALKRDLTAAREQIAALTADRDSWAEQDSQHVGELVEAMKRVAELEKFTRKIGDDLQCVLAWEEKRMGAVSAGLLRDCIARALLAPSPEPKPAYGPNDAEFGMSEHRHKGEEEPQP